MDDKARKKQRVKRGGTFALRGGIAVAGIALVLSNISLHDRVQVLDPVTHRVQKLRVLNNAGEADAQYTVVPDDGSPPRAVGRGDLWVRPDRTHANVRLSDRPGDRVENVRLYAVKPG